MSTPQRILVIGGGAAGFFAAITSAENSNAQVFLYEATPHLLSKVKISGGGRCNVTHACFEPEQLVKNYPRGGRELLGAFHRFQPRDTLAWFNTRGVETKTEEDGRMFPTSDNSESIVNALMDAAQKNQVKILVQRGVKTIQYINEKFEVEL
ncbi:MAG: NAD(P)/FAD-dependent oxidoreductase, partial [Opitutae bacterium]